MGEGLGEVAEELAARRVDLLGEEADVVAVGKEVGEAFGRPLHFAHPGERLDRPEAADGEGRLAAGEAVGARRVAVEEVARPQRAVEVGEGAPEARPPRVDEAVDAEEEEAGVGPLFSQDVDVAPQAVAPARGLDGVADLSALAGETLAGAAERDLPPLVHRQQAVEGDPAHHLGEGMVEAPGAFLPDPFVGLPPEPAGGLAEPGEEARLGAVELAAAADELAGRLDQLAVDVELELAGRAVAHPHRPRAAVAVQGGQGVLRDARLAVHVVEHPELGMAHPRGIEEPGEEGLPLLLVAQVEERGQGPGGIARPAVAVVPVARAADRLGERGGGGGDHRARGSVGQELQQEDAAQDRLGEGAVVAAAAGPGLPPEARTLQPSGGGGPQEWNGGGTAALGDEGKEAPLPPPQAIVAHDPAAGAVRVERHLALENEDLGAGREGETELAAILEQGPALAEEGTG